MLDLHHTVTANKMCKGQVPTNTSTWLEHVLHNLHKCICITHVQLVWQCIRCILDMLGSVSCGDVGQCWTTNRSKAQSVCCNNYEVVPSRDQPSALPQEKSLDRWTPKSAWHQLCSYYPSLYMPCLISNRGMYTPA